MALTATPANQASYASSANGTSHTLTFGFTPVKGSTLILFFRAGDAITVSTPPAGWTVSNSSAFSGRVTGFGYYKISDGTETSAAVVFGASTPCTAWVGNWPDRLIFGSSTTLNTSATTFPTMNNVTTTAAPTLLVALWTNGTAATSAYTAGTVTDGHTEQAFPSTSGGTTLNMAVSTKVTNTAASNNGVGITAATSSDHNANFFVFPLWGATPIFICGAECGIATFGAASAGVEHWTSGGGASVVTSGPSPMRSTRAFRCNPTAGTATLTTAFASAIGSPATCVKRLYIYFTTLPSANTRIVVTGGANALGVAFKQSDSSLYACGSNATTLGASGISVTTGTWYRLDVRTVYGTTRTADVSVDGVAAGQYSLGGQTAATATDFTFGVIDTCTADAYIDDIIVSGTAADFPIGAGTIAGLYPNGDRTNTAANPTDGNVGHFYSATTDFAKGASGAVATGAQNAESTSWQSLQNPLSTTIGSTWIADLLGAGTEHMTWKMGALPAGVSVVNGVMLVATTHSAAATANNQAMDLTTTTGAVSLAAWNLDLSETTITVPIAIIGSGGGGTFSIWDTTNGNGRWMPSDLDGNTTFFRWGNSSDVNPDPYLDGVCLEVDYVPLVATPILKISPYRQLLNH